MAVRFHPLPTSVFPPEARPYVERLNRELRDLFAVESVLGQAISNRHSDASIVRNEEPQVALSRVTPTPASTPADTPGGSDSVTAATAFGTDNRVIRSNGTARDVQASAVTLDDTGAILPVTDNAQNLGSASLRWAGLWAPQVTIGGVTITRPVQGAASSTDNAIVRWDGAAGTALQNSLTTISDVGDLTVSDGTDTLTIAPTSGFITGTKVMGFVAQGGGINQESSIFFDSDASGSGFDTNDTFRFSRYSTFDAGIRYARFYFTDVATPFLFVNQVLRVGWDNIAMLLYKDPNSRWQKVDGLRGGGFGFIDAGTTEPTT